MSAQLRAAAILDINLLPREQRPPEISARSMLIALLFAVAVLALVPLSMRAAYAKADADFAADRADQAATELKALQVELAQSRALRIEIDAAEAEVAALEADAAQLQGGARPLGDDLAMLWAEGVLHPDSRIEHVSAQPGTLVVEGTAPGPLEAIAYAAALVDASGFPSARMISFAPDARAGGAFTVEVMR